MLEAVSEQSKHSNMHHLRSYQRYPQISLLTRGAEGNEMKMYLSDLIISTTGSLTWGYLPRPVLLTFASFPRDITHHNISTAASIFYISTFYPPLCVVMTHDLI